MTFAASCIYISPIHRASPAAAPRTTTNANNSTAPLDFAPCANGFSGNQAIPSTGCKHYISCWKGAVESEEECGDPLLFDNARQYCNFPSDVCCKLVNDMVLCPGYDNYGYNLSSMPTSEIIETQPTVSNQQPGMFPSPSEPVTIQVPGSSSSSMSPSLEIILQVPGLSSISLSPTVFPTFFSSIIISSTDSPTIHGGSAILHIESKRDLIEQYVFRSYNNGDADLAYPSTMYTYGPFIESLKIMGVEGFGADFKFYLWEGGAKYHYGLVNLAAFLANCMVESIEADTCDELNWQQESGRHAISNACGQEFRSYQNETCDTSEDIFSCEVLASVQITAASNSTETSAPPPFQCKPGSGEGYFSGYWDAPNGPFVPNTKYANDLGRTDTEGCCFWGRGALLTRGVCNIGKLNYYLGKRGADIGNNTLYPTVDFCRFPEAPCAGSNSEELRWIVAFFEWAERVQRYLSPNWQFDEKLIEFVDNGMVDDNSFIDSVSRILSRGCHEYDCSEFEVRMLDRRRSNFYLIINDIFDVKSLVNQQSSTIPTVHAASSPPRPTTESHTGTTSYPTNSSPKNELIGLEGNGGLTLNLHRTVMIAVAAFPTIFLVLA